MKISLFSRNGFQDPLFEGVGDYLKQSGAEVSLIYPRAGESSQVSFYPESIMSDLILEDEIDFKAEFQRICSTYNNVNRIIQSEREINYFPDYFGDRPVTRNEKIRLCTAAFISFERYVADFKPNIIVSEMIVGMLDGALYEIARSNGVKYLGIRSSKIRPGIIFCDNPYDKPIFFNSEIKALESKPVDELTQKASIIVDSFLSPKIVPHYMEMSARKFTIFSISRIKSALRVLFKSKELPEVSIYQHNRLNAFREKFIKMKNLRGWTFNQEQLFTACKEYKYFVYAAHFEPEASVQIRAFDFSDQLSLIKKISRLLPPDCILVVKEHKGNQGFRKPEFYRELSHIYNVFCASPNTDLRKLIKNSQGVITLTGRVGLEALIDNIPVIAFGNTFWSSLSDVITPKSPKDIKTALSSLSNIDIVNRKKSKPELKFEICCLLIAYDQLTYEGNFIHGSNEFTASENLKRISNAIEDIYRQIANSHSE